MCRWSAALVFDMAYGHRIASLDDPLVELNERVTEETVLAGSPGSMLVDFFPICTPRIMVDRANY